VNKKLVLLGVCAVAIGLLVVVYLLNPSDEADIIYTHVYIHGVAVGGMNREEAEATLMERFQPGLEARKVSYILNGEVAAEFTFGDFGAAFDFGELVESALEYSHLSNLTRRVARFFGRPHEMNSPPHFAFNPERMEDIMIQLSKKLDEQPLNAAFAEENGQFVIKEERDGRGVDTEAAAALTREALIRLEDATVELNIKTVSPMYTTKHFDFKKSALGYYETNYLTGDDPRIRNVRRASERVHNQILYPGQVFSAGKVIAANDPASGYEAAIVLVKGEPVEDIGGGVCQVVTTLYNAVLRAELEIVQRHNHSARVSYAELGFDATVAGDYFDLKFKNNTAHPILIVSHTENGILRMGIYGYESRDPGRTLRFVARQVELIQPEPYRQVVDPSIPRGEQFVTLESQMGYRIEVFKYVYMHGQRVEEVKINESVYKPLQGVIAIGAG